MMRLSQHCLLLSRFLWEHPRSLEIYPGDASTLRSHGLSGTFFVHYHNINDKVCDCAAQGSLLSQLELRLNVTVPKVLKL